MRTEAVDRIGGGGRVTREFRRIAVGTGPVEVFGGAVAARSRLAGFAAAVREAGFVLASLPGFVVTAGRPGRGAEPGFRGHPAR